MRCTSYETLNEGFAHRVRCQVAHRASRNVTRHMQRKVTRPRPNPHSLIVSIDAICIHTPTPALLIYSRM